MMPMAPSFQRTRAVMARSTLLIGLACLLLLPQCRRDSGAADAPAPSSSGVVKPSGSATPPKGPPPEISERAGARPSAPERDASLSAAPPKAAPAPSSCQDVLLTGSIGATPVVMELRICGEMVGGRYYYRRNNESLMLFGSLEGDANTVRRTLELREFGGDEPFKPNHATLTGNVSITDRMTIDAESSKWERDGRSLPWQATEDTTGETYSSLRRVFGPMQKAKDGSFSYRTVKHTWEYVVGSREGIAPPGPLKQFPGSALGAPEDCCGARRAVVEATWLELLEVKPGLDLAATNRTLSNLLNDYAPPADSVAGGNSSLRVVTARGRVLSFILETDGVYTGAYPDHNEYGVTLDLRDGRRMAKSDLLELPDTLDFRAVLEKRLPLSPLDKDEPCPWPEWETYGQPYVHLGEDGLHLTPDFPHVAKACQYANVGRLLPRDLAVRYARRGSLLSDVLAGRWGP